MYNINNLGDFARIVKRYADRNDYVPESGDRPELFTWLQPCEWTEESWEQWVADATEATREAEQAIAEWQKQSR
jgi:hypothetical protein